MDDKMIPQVDSEGYHYQFIIEVTYHKNENSKIHKVHGLIKPRNGNLHLKRKNNGRKLLVEWREGSFDWVPLEYLKQSNTVKLT